MSTEDWKVFRSNGVNAFGLDFGTQPCRYEAPRYILIELDNAQR